VDATSGEKRRTTSTRGEEQEEKNKNQTRRISTGLEWGGGNRRVFAAAAVATAAAAAATVPLELSGWLVDGQPQMDGPLVDGNRHSFFAVIFKLGIYNFFYFLMDFFLFWVLNSSGHFSHQQKSKTRKEWVFFYPTGGKGQKGIKKGTERGYENGISIGL